MPSTTENIRFIKDYDKLIDSATQKDPKWLSDYRLKHSSRIAEFGLPTVKDEEWKYTNISSLIDYSFNISQSDTVLEAGAFESYINESEINIVFVNGQFSQKLSNTEKLPKNITFKPLPQAISDNEKEIQNLLEKFDKFEHSTVTSINNALSNDGVFIKVDKGAILEDLIHIVHVTSIDNEKILTLPRTLISQDASSEITVLESHVSFNNKSTYLSSPVTNIYLSENAILHYCKAQDESNNAFHIGQTQVWQEQNSNFDGFSFMTGGQITRNNLDIVINGEGANANLNALYSNVDKQHVDNHTCVDHRVANCTSNQLYKGILNGAARAVFNGKIFVKPIAQQTNSYQLNKNLLLGHDCRVDTKPQLEIFADDVKCTHGATIGQLDENEIFYLQTRCIDKKRAVEMLSRGFADDALNTIANESIRQKLHLLLEPSFSKI